MTIDFERCYRVPCHRVVGADGSLTGCGGGLDWQQQLFDHEAHTRAQRGLRSY